MNQCTSDTWTEASSQRCRERLARMTDEALQQYFDACIFMTRPRASWDTPRESYIIQLAIAEQEMERRAIMQE